MSKSCRIVRKRSLPDGQQEKSTFGGWPSNPGHECPGTPGLLGRRDPAATPPVVNILRKHNTMSLRDSASLDTAQPNMDHFAWPRVLWRLVLARGCMLGKTDQREEHL
jgi:hypothetical protein